jgi:hypothetical protein
MITVNAEQLRAKLQVQEHDYDFYKCKKCGRLITRIEEMLAFVPGTKHYGHICPCGSQKYSPTNLPWWGWLLPRVWKFAWLRIRGIA